MFMAGHPDVIRRASPLGTRLTPRFSVPGPEVHDARGPQSLPFSPHAHSPMTSRTHQAPKR